jgi:5-methylcytosine-specific restriction endonuclease McrA
MESIKKELAEKYEWAPWQIKAGIRAKFKCEYCGKDLLESVDNYFWIWQIDHIKPTSKGGDDDYDKEQENLAVSCLTCNYIKSDWWDESILDSESRDDKVEHAKSYIKAKREEKAAFLDRMKGLIRKLDTK